MAVPLEASMRQPVAMPYPRTARPDDLCAIEDIVRSAYSPYVKRIGRAPGLMLDNYGALIRDGRVYVVEQEGAIQGILVLTPEKDAMLLDNGLCPRLLFFLFRSGAMRRNSHQLIALLNPKEQS